MSLTKDGFYKSFSGAIGNNNYLLEAGGGHIGWGNSANQIPYSNGAINTSLNADMTDGLHVHGGRNNEANKIVRTDGSGYIQTGYINTNVGTEDSLSWSRVFFEYNNDGYIRKASISRAKSVFFGGQVGSPSVPIYWTGSAFATCIVSFGNQSYGEHNANNINDNGIKYYNSNGPSTSLGATTSDGALYSQAYSTSWVAQIAQDYRNGGLYVRGKNNGTWQSWYRVWDNRTTYVSGGKGYIGGTEITQVNNSDTVDGHHQDHLLPYRYTYGAQTNSGSANWYVRIQTASYISEDCTIYVRGTGNNTSSDLVIHVLCRENRFWGWETSYNGVRINGIAKETGAPEIIYLRMPSSTTSITFKSTHSLTIDKADYSSKSYMSLGEGLFANYIYGRIQNADYADTLSNPGKYYWANIPMQTSSDSTKQPTFGRTNITYAATNGTSALQVNIGSTNYAYGVDIQSSIAVGNTVVSLLAGVNHSTNNQLSGLFYYAGNNSTSNRFGFGFYGNDNILNIRADKRVGICTTAPAYTLDVTGTIRATSRIYANEWIEFSQAYTGLYWPNGNNASHFHPNDATTYGNFVLRGSRGGYSGIQFGRSTNYMTIMDNATDKGLYQEGQRWILYYSRSTGNVSVRSSGALGYNINLYGSVGTDSHMYSYGFHHLSHNNDDAVLLAGGGWEYKSNYYRNLGGGNYITITVNGDANTYYPVVIGSPSDYYPYQFVNITRHYSETAPDTWNTSTHKGGLSMAIFWNGSSYWDGNASGSEAFVVRLYQSYCTMVGGVDNSTAGKVVWLRGGGANYHIFSMNGRSQSATVYLSTYTDSASRSFAPRTTPVTPTVQWPGDIQNGAGYLRDRSNGTATYTNYGASGLGLGSITWLTCWNGYELRAISKGELGGLTNVYQHTGNNVDYPLVWSNQNNTSTVQANQLHKSYADLVYNPANKEIKTWSFAPQGENTNRGIHFPGGAWINSIGTSIIFRNATIRFGGSGWDWNAWAGLNFDGNTTINIGMPNNSHWTANSNKTAGTIRTVSSKIEIFPDGNSNYGEGLRIHSASNGWTTLMLAGTDNTGFNGTSANSWSLHAYGGNFYLSKNGSTGGTSYMDNISNKWYFNTTSGNEAVNVGGWINTVGACGWYNSTYGGGWWMTDSTYVRVYNGKYLYTTYQYYDVGNQDYTIDHVYASNDRYIRPMAFSTFGNKLRDSGYLDGRYLRYEGWWNSGSGQNVDDAHGMIFGYVNHNLPGSWGIVATFEEYRGSSYRLQLYGDGWNSNIYYRVRSSDRGGWYGGWKRLLDSVNWATNTNSASGLLRSDGGIAWFNWSGQPGQPTWLWGGNSFNTYYVYNPSNFDVNSAAKLRITGYQSNGLSFYQTDSSFDGSPASSWAHYIIANYGDGASYYHYTIRLPFWGPPQYRRQSGNTSSVTGWYTFLTSENYTSYVNNYYWANVKISTSSNTGTTPTVSTIYASNWFRSTGATGWYSESYGGGIWMTDSSWIRTYGSKHFYVEGGNFAVSGSAGIGRTSMSYRLDIQGDSYARGWHRADSGFYCEGTGVHFTHQGSVGEIDMTSNNEFLWGSSNSSLFFNYRGVSRGTTVTNYIWNAGSSSTYAGHTQGWLNLFPGSRSSWGEGIRLHSASNGWASLIFCGTDNTGDSGTSANSWSLHAYGGNFYLNKNNSSTAAAPRLWGHGNGYTFGSTSRSSANVTVTNWIEVTGTTSATMSYSTTNPRITFSESGTQAVGIVYTDFDSYRASKGLKVMDVDNNDTGNVWLEVQGYTYSAGFCKNGSSNNYALTGAGGHFGIHTGRNNEANKIVRTDGSGYIQAGWINTTSGGFYPSDAAISRVYCSNDDYLRYLSPSDFINRLNAYWANIKVSSSSSTATSPTFSTCYTTNWFRSKGNTGWYSESYGGGWWMADSTWLRNYNNKSLFMYTSGANSSSTPIARFVKGWDCGDRAVYDTVVISSNDCTSLRLIESDGTCTGISAGDNYSTFTSAGSGGMRFFVHGNNSSNIYGGMSGDELLWLRNGCVGIKKGLQLAKYVTSSNYANFYGWDYVPSLVCYNLKGNGSNNSFLGLPLPDEAHLGQIIFIGGSRNYNNFIWGVPNGTGVLSSVSNYRTGNYCIQEQGGMGNPMRTGEDDDSRFLVCVRFPETTNGYVWRLYACCWNN